MKKNDFKVGETLYYITYNWFERYNETSGHSEEIKETKIIKVKQKNVDTERYERIEKKKMSHSILFGIINYFFRTKEEAQNFLEHKKERRRLIKKVSHKCTNFEHLSLETLKKIDEIV